MQDTDRGGGFEHAPLPMLVLDRDGRIRAANTRACEWLRRPRPQLESLSVWDLDERQDPDAWRDSFARVLAEEQLLFRMEIDGGDDVRLPAEGWLRAIPESQRVSCVLLPGGDRTPPSRTLKTESSELNEILKLVPFAMTVLNRELKIVGWNSAATELYGYGPDEILGQSVGRLIPPEIREQRLAGLRSHLDRGLMWGPLAQPQEARCVRPDGQKIPIELAMVSIDGPGDLAFCGFARGIADRVAAQDALRQERDLLEAVMSTSVMAITVLDTEGQIVFANERAEAILGLERVELTHRAYDAPEWKHTDLDGGPWPDEKQPFRRVLETGLPVYDVRHAIEWPDGTRKLLSIHGAPVKGRDGTLTHLVFSIEDITQRLQTLEQMRTSEARLSDLVGRLSFGVLLRGPKGEMWEWNEAALEMLGLTETQLMGRTSFDPRWNVIHEDGKPFPSETHPVPMAIATGEPVRNVVMGVSRPKKPGVEGGDVERRWLLVNAEPALEDDGRIKDVVCTFSDVTELKTLQESLRQAQKLESIGRLAGGVAHDFNNLLTTILGFAELGLTEPGVHIELRAYLQTITNAAERGAALTQQLLGYARRQVIQPEIVCLAALLEELSGMLRRTLPEDMGLELQTENELWPVSIDPNQLHQIVLNLSTNARDAMSSGGKITISCRNRAGDDAGLPDGVEPGDYVELALADTGSGIPAEVLPLVFEPFFTTKPVGQGTGLGLSTCYGIVKQNGGHLSVHSEPGVGSRFEILLPRAQEPCRAAQSRPAPAKPGRASGCVLLVEDDPDVLEIARRALEGGGFQVLRARNAQDALLRLEKHLEPVDLLVTDVIMPGISGRELAELLRDRDPTLRVLYTSGHADEALFRSGVDRERVSFLAKPYSPSGLCERAQQLVTSTAQPAE